MLGMSISAIIALGDGACFSNSESELESIKVGGPSSSESDDAEESDDLDEFDELDADRTFGSRKNVSRLME